MFKIEHVAAVMIVGKKTRTTNERAFEDIPNQCKRFCSASVAVSEGPVAEECLNSPRETHSRDLKIDICVRLMPLAREGFGR